MRPMYCLSNVVDYYGAERRYQCTRRRSVVHVVKRLRDSDTRGKGKVSATKDNYDRQTLYRILVNSKEATQKVYIRTSISGR